MPLKSLLIFWIIVISTGLTAQNIESYRFNKHITNFSDKEYGQNFNAQNWSIAQDKDGIMYFGNSYNVLTYDGINWSSIAITQKSDYITSLLATESGNIYWGANGDFGVIETDKRGKQKAQSFLDKISEKDRDFSVVWKTLKFKDQIVFFAQENIFIYNPANNSIKIIHPLESFHLAFIVEDQLFVRDRAYGLMKYEGKSFMKVLAGDIFKNEGIFGILPLDNGSYMIVSQQIGLFFYNPKSNSPSIISIKSDDTEELNQQQIIGAIKLSDGNIALNTASKGVIIINQKGKILFKIDLNSGITDNDVKQVFQDKNGNLWLATNNGISLINYSSPISIFPNTEATGLYGSVNCISEINNSLLVGTTTGLYILDQHKDKRFHKIIELNKNISSMVKVGNVAIIGTDEGVYKFEENQIEKINNTNSIALVYSEINKYLYVIGNNGFSILNTQVNFKTIHFDKDLNINAINAIILPQSDGTDQIWIGTIGFGLWKLKVDKQLNIESEIYSEQDGIGNTWIKPFILNNQIYAGNSTGLLKLITTEEIKKQIKDSIDQELLKAYFTSADIPAIDSGIISFIETNQNKIWLVYEGKVGFLDNNGTINQTPFLSLELGKINSLYPHNNSKIWIGGNDGLAWIDLENKINYTNKPDILIRSAKIQYDSILFYKSENNSTYYVDYKYNTIAISFSSTFNENGKKPLFSYKLENFDENWSDWSAESTAIFKKLNEGKYIFKVRAKNIYGVQSEIKEIVVIINPPWYRTFWAYTFYIILFFALIIMAVKIYTYRLKQKNIQLEKIIEERTAEILNQKAEIETQRDLISLAHNEITSSIQYAKRIQTAVLPTKEFEHPVINDYFILFKPKDVVSGDFYYAKLTSDTLIVAAADCTGHGVPGAFMSMLGISLLNEIVEKENITNSATILNKLRQGVISALKQKGGDEDQKDGMDISLISINLTNNHINWAGAYNPLFILSSNKPEFENEDIYKIFESENTGLNLFEIKANRMPIGISDRMNPFEYHNIKLKKGDKVYMFSDGFIDQFGGKEGKKFMINNFRKALIETANSDLATQKRLLEEKLLLWISHTNPETGESYHQIDDICVIGLEF